MTQYYSVKLHSSQNLVPKQQNTFSPPRTTAATTNTAHLSPIISAPNRIAHRNNENKATNKKVYNCASYVSNQLLVGPSIINASSVTKNKTSLPRIKELDTITHYQHHEQYSSSPLPPQQYYSPSPAPVTQYRAAVSNSPQFNPSVVNKYDGRTTTITTTTSKCPLKRQRTITPPESIIEIDHLTTTNSKKGNQQQAQFCHSCKSTETPEWRKGPLGPRTLCNACGLIWSKLCKQQDVGNKSRRKFTKNSSSSISSPVTIEDCVFSNNPSPSTSSTLQDSEKDSNEKLALSFLLS